MGLMYINVNSHLFQRYKLDSPVMIISIDVLVPLMYDDVMIITSA